jgi:glutamate 5-kinase
MSTKKAKRITIKIGTRVLTADDNRIDKTIINQISSQVIELMNKGIEVVIVSSGAIGAGLGLLKLEKQEKKLSELQAIASVGQNHLMDMYNECFEDQGYVAGQILLTQEDFNDRIRSILY